MREREREREKLLYAHTVGVVIVEVVELDHTEESWIDLTEFSMGVTL